MSRSKPSEASVLRRWIEQGAPGLPRGRRPATPRRPTTGPSRRSRTPSHRRPATSDRARTPIDRFLLARLESEGLSFAPEATRAALIRRVSFDLTGLPPSPEEVRRFLADDAPDAYERMVDRYLASPHYGERWGKFWLDAAGYADSNGYFNADTDRPLAYRYRDYVARAFNEDRPFDRLDPRADRRRRAGRLPTWRVPDPGDDRTARRHPLPSQRPGRHRRERRQPGRGPRRPVTPCWKAPPRSSAPRCSA